jgi:hypothetical protein
MRKILFVILIAGAILGGCGVKTKIQEQVSEKVAVQSVLVLRESGANLVEVSVNSESKLSAIDFKVEATGQAKITGFEANKEVFNSELVNKGTGTNWNVTLAAMTATKDLKSGEMVFGNIKYSGTGKLVVRGMKLVGPGASGGKPTQEVLKDVEIEVGL